MSSPSAISLQRGQRLHLHVSRGKQIVAVRGACDIIGPAEWLAEQVIRPTTSLREGEAHTMPHGGLVTIESHGGAELRCIPAERDVSAAVRKFLAFVQRRFAVAVHRKA
jgi:hypothetical protein